MKNKCKNIYITTPIYYVNDIAHIGHAYTTIIADMLTRYSKIVGYDTYFLTGTDEHGLKIAQSAEKKGKTPQEYSDIISGKFRQLWDDMDISYDKFIRTTDHEHKMGVKKAFETMFQNGDIYKGNYEGNYCVGCETFFTTSQLIDDEGCPDCKRPTTVVKEESYFFRLSKYQDRLLELYETTPDFILPKSKAKEIINFVKGGLNDLSISRTSFSWGVPLPDSMDEPEHVMYVWLDALMNYLTGLGYGGDKKLLSYWPANIHMVGKDILKFHSIFWPAFLLSLDMPLPKHICAHGWWTKDGEKMSKSKGNVVNPREIISAYGLDEFRYFLMREVPFGQDGDFSKRALVDRINSDLSNDLGNLLNRIQGMSGKYFKYKLNSKDVAKYHQKELNIADNIVTNLENYIFVMQISRYIEDIWKLVAMANKAIADYEPWNLMKDGKTDEAMALVAFVANLMAKVAVLVDCVIPHKAKQIAVSLGFEINPQNYDDIIVKRQLVHSFFITKTEQLFPKIEENFESIALPTQETNPSVKTTSTIEDDNIITIDSFFATTIKVGQITEVHDIKKSDKLYRLLVDIGENEPRQIVAGIKAYYTKDELQDTQVCIVANLKPAKLMGILSEGMVLASKDDSGLSLIRPDKEKTKGTKIS